MNKKILITIGILVIAIVLLGGCIRGPKPTTTTTIIITACGNNICESGEDGYNCLGDCCVSGDGICRYGCTPKNDDDCETRDLSQVKVASLYQRVTDYVAVGGSVDDVIVQLKETRTDFIFRGFWKWEPCPDREAKTGYSYQNLKTAINEIKKEMPEVIFCGAVPAQYLTEGEINPKTGRPFTKKELEAMALDPFKWNLPVTEEEIEEIKRIQKRGGYYPDLTNPDFQELLLDWAEKQIDCGADAIWIDGLFAGPSILVRTGRIEPNHPFVKESLESASLIVDEIHEYGYSKHQKHIYVGSWATFLDFPYPPPNLDFVTKTPSGREMESKTLKKEKWDDLVVQVRENMGQDFPIFAFIDWSGRDDTALAMFSQKLSTSEQNEMLGEMDQFFQGRGIIFVYPVHGGFMGKGATRLSYGNYKVYDSLAPEFQTYETIKELVQNKSESKKE